MPTRRPRRQDNPLTPRPAALCRARRRTSSICTWPGRRRTSTCSTTSRSWCATAASIARSRSCAAGASRSPAACRKLLGTPQRFRQHGRSGAWILGRGCRTLATIADELYVHQVDAHRPVQSRPGGAAAVHRLAAVRPAVDGLVGDLRPRLGEPEPARLHRPRLQRHLPERRQQRLEQRLSAVGLPGRAVPLARAIRCCTSPIRPAWTATCAG